MGLAYIPISYDVLDALPGVQKVALGYFDGDDWIEPERRYNLARLRKDFHLDEWWHHPRDFGHPIVWNDPMNKRICLLVESEDIPETEDGHSLPAISPIFRHDYDPETGKLLGITYLGLDTSSLQRS